MLRLIVVGALVRRLRFALAASAIVLGVALVSGTAILAQSVRHSYDLLLRQVTSGVDVYVRGPETDRKQGISDFAPVPDAMLAQVRPVAGVAVAQGQIVRLGQLVTPGGAFLNAHRPTYAYSWPAVPRISPFTLVSGRAPAADGEVVLDQATARADGLAPGGPIQVSLDFASPQPARLVGLVAPRQGGDLTGVGAVFVDPAWAQRLLRLGPQWDLLELAARPGVGPDQLRARVAAALPDDGTSAITSREFADAQVENLTRRSGSLTALLLALSLLAAVIGAGIILNTLGTLTWQRRRELALLRVLGQTRGQIWLGVVGEAAVVGLVASTAGALAGIPAALALRALVALAGQDVSGTRLYVEPATVLAAIGLGTLATAAIATVPAVRASRVAPVEAMREAEIPERGPLPVALLAAIALLAAAGLGAVVAGLAGPVATRVGLVAAGSTAAFLALVAALPSLARRPLAGLGALVGRAGASGRVAAGNVRRDPRRSAAPAIALLVAVGLVTAVSVVAASAGASITGLVRRADRADLVVSSDAAPGLDPEVIAKLREAPGLAVVSEVGAESFTVDGRADLVTALDPLTFPRVLALPVAAGDLGALGPGAIAVTSSAAAARGLRLGDSVAVQFGEPQTGRLRIVAVVRDNGITRDWIVPIETYRRGYHNPTIRTAFVKARPGFGAADVRREVDIGAAGFPGVSVSDPVQYAMAQAAAVERPVALVDALVLLAVAIALLGVMNTLSLSVVERTRDLGLLRVLGMTRGQLALTVHLEALMVVTLGLLGGAAAGLAGGLALVAALGFQGITDLVVPAGPLLAAFALVLAGALAAAALPARRAARLGLEAAIAG